MNSAIKHEERKIDVWRRVFSDKVGAQVEREGGTVVMQLRTPNGQLQGLTMPMEVAEAFRDMLMDACAIQATSVEPLDLAVTRQKEPPPQPPISPRF